jgi:hypothetical protein
MFRAFLVPAGLCFLNGVHMYTIVDDGSRHLIFVPIDANITHAQAASE